jgi:hypothetical protein
MEKYPSFRRNRPTDFHNPVRAQLIRGNLQIIGSGRAAEKGLCWRENRREFVVKEDT